jgi:hypothetical protein
MKEAHGSELGVRGRSWARASERCADRAQEDPEDGVGDPPIVLQEGTQALGHGEHPRRPGRGGGTWSVRWAATSYMRGALHEGQTALPLHENGISRSWPHSSQRALAKPWARMPHSR